MIEFKNCKILNLFFSDLDLNSSSITYSKDDETVTLTFDEPLPVSPDASLSLNFTGELNDKMKGFYRSRYTRPDGTEQYCAVTQFEVISRTSVLLYLGSDILDFAIHHLTV